MSATVSACGVVDGDGDVDVDVDIGDASPGLVVFEAEDSMAVASFARADASVPLEARITVSRCEPS